MNPKHIILSKTNQIGDVLFALPLASQLKKLYPECKISFLSRAYTRDLIEQYEHVDQFINWETLDAMPDSTLIQSLRELDADTIIHVYPQKKIAKMAKHAGIKLRIGSLNRLHNWFYCNKLVNISRKRSPLHETQLDMKYLQPVGGKSFYSLQQIITLRQFKPMPATAYCLNLLDDEKLNLILHPKTRGEHIEWPLEHFASLISSLPKDKFNIFVTGVEHEGEKVRPIIVDPFPHVHDLTGKISLAELQQLIAHADGLICASTGPVHLAAAFGIHTLGLYAPIKPFHAGRWGPVGKKAAVLSVEKNCDSCRHKMKCKCIAEIEPQQIYMMVMNWQQMKRRQRELEAEPIDL